MILRWKTIPFLFLLLFNFFYLANSENSCPAKEIIYKKSELPLPELLGSSIYALVRPKSPPKTSEERISREYQEEALDRLIRCRINNTRCYRKKKPAPKVEFGKFCWATQKFEPLRAGISQLRCKTPRDPHDATVQNYWSSLLRINNKTEVEIGISISNFFLDRSQKSFFDVPSIGWADIIDAPIGMIPMLLGQTGVLGVDPLDPMFPLNPLFPYSPMNPFIHLDSSHENSPYNMDGPFYPLNPASPFSPFNPGNPFNALSPMLLLPPSDPMSPWNPASPYFPMSPHSPYNPDFEFSPLNRGFDLDGPPPCSPFSPLNGNFILSKHSPWYPLGPLVRLSFLPETDHHSPLNPHSPFHPIAALHPQNPLVGLDPNDFMSPLNLKEHPVNVINGEEIKRSITEISPAYIPGQTASVIESSPFFTTGTPQMAPPINQPLRAVGKWFYRFQKAPQQISAINPCDPKSPFFAGDAYSPFHPLHPSNPYSILNPLNTLPITDPRSPYNPRSSNFAGNPESPYNPAHSMNPFNPDSFIFTCRQTGSLHPENPRSPFYLLNPRSPFNPMNPFSPYNPKHPLLSGLDESHALNPSIRTSPFHPSQRTSPYNPDNYRKLNPQYPLNPLNDRYKRITSSTDPEPLLGWYNGVKEDFSKIPPPPPAPGTNIQDQLLPYSPPSIEPNCPPAPPAPPPPQPPYFPGYYQWEPSWSAPRYIKTSMIPSNDPIQPQQWQQIWERLWGLKCKREAYLAHPTSPYGKDLAVIDIPQTNK